MTEKKAVFPRPVYRKFNFKYLCREIGGMEIVMKSTGMVRMVDHLGRIVLPIEIRKILDIKQKDALEIFTDNDKIILQKYQPACVFCNNIENIVYFNGKRVCANCVEKLKEQF